GAEDHPKTGLAANDRPSRKAVATYALSPGVRPHGTCARRAPPTRRGRRLRVRPTLVSAERTSAIRLLDVRAPAPASAGNACAGGLHLATLLGSQLAHFLSLFISRRASAVLSCAHSHSLSDMPRLTRAVGVCSHSCRCAANASRVSANVPVRCQ